VTDQIPPLDPRAVFSEEEMAAMSPIFDTTEDDGEVCSKCGTTGCLEDARSGWYE
jgi:hypothetical protein